MRRRIGSFLERAGIVTALTFATALDSLGNGLIIAIACIAASVALIMIGYNLKNEGIVYGDLRDDEDYIAG